MKQTYTNRLLATLGVLVTFLLGAGCEQEKIEYDWDSGGDHTRNRAKKLFLGQRVTDSINAGLGDHTDWKEVRIRESGTMGVTISIDDTRTMDGHVAIKDGFGVELERRPINPSDNIYTFDQIPVYQGEYYVQVFVKRGNSVYTAGATFEPLPTSNVAPVPTAPPEPDEPRPKNWKPKDPNAHVDKTPVAPPKTPESKPAETEETAEGPTDNSVTLRGRIVRVIPQDDGGAILTIVGVGSGDGVQNGMTGTIVGFGKTFKITSVSKRGALAVTAAEAEDVKPYHNVTIVVRR